LLGARKLDRQPLELSIPYSWHVCQEETPSHSKSLVRDATFKRSSPVADDDRNIIRIATRTSPLAFWQANYVRDRILECTDGCTVELVDVSTIGDRDRATALASMGGQGVFTKEVQNAVLSGGADLAVHSLKDLPTDATPGLKLAGVPERAPVADALVLPAAFDIAVPERLESMPFDVLTTGARIGTGSPRRQAQLFGQICRCWKTEAMSRHVCRNSTTANSTRSSWRKPGCVA
jgi:hypothetical protein